VLPRARKYRSSTCDESIPSATQLSSRTCADVVDSIVAAERRRQDRAAGVLDAVPQRPGGRSSTGRAGHGSSDSTTTTSPGEAGLEAREARRRVFLNFRPMPISVGSISSCTRADANDQRV